MPTLYRILSQSTECLYPGSSPLFRFDSLQTSLPLSYHATFENCQERHLLTVPSFHGFWWLFVFQNQTDKLGNKYEIIWFFAYALGDVRHFPEFGIYAHTFYVPVL